MSDFVVSLSQTLSVGVAAADVMLGNQVIEASQTAALGNGIKHGRMARVRNTHATQSIFIKKYGTATVTSFDIIVLAGQVSVFGLPLERDRISMIASGATTTGIIDIGDFTDN